MTERNSEPMTREKAAELREEASVLGRQLRTLNLQYDHAMQNKEPAEVIEALENQVQEFRERWAVADKIACVAFRSLDLKPKSNPVREAQKAYRKALEAEDAAWEEAKKAISLQVQAERTYSERSAETVLASIALSEAKEERKNNASGKRQQGDIDLL